MKNFKLFPNIIFVLFKAILVFMFSKFYSSKEIFPGTAQEPLAIEYEAWFCPYIFATDKSFSQFKGCDSNFRKYNRSVLYNTENLVLLS